MSSIIWTQCAGDSEVRALHLSPWRVVEAQHQVSTRKLVDSVEEQELLEEMIDRVKPPDVTTGRLHYLLFTPFRYPPLRHGSRFGGRHERGIWYGSLERRAAFAEVAYYRLLFLEGTQSALGTLTTALTAFTARIRTSRGIDLVIPPFERHRKAIASPTSYASSQALGTAMRNAGVEAFRYPSARDIVGGINVAAFVPSVFGNAKPRSFETWHSSASRERVEVTRGDYMKRESFAFPREQFLVNGALPAPAL
ncbi:MAG TPA: RES family NAD+ phosphorylase [Gemmatimonadaceae bacterium]|nr:RES family NAD+ phosphorylase [Gemmatimonadaceae bacterium]